MNETGNWELKTGILGSRGSRFPVASCPFPELRDKTNWFPVSSSQFPACSKEERIGISKQLTKDWSKVKEEVEFLSRYLTKWNLVKAITILSEARKSRFLRRRTPKYGSMNKAFTDEELERFFSVIDEPKFRLLFSYQAVLGLRVGEAVKLHVKDINLKTRELRIGNEKSDRADYLPIPDKLFASTLEYISNYEQDINKAHGYLFFSSPHENHLKTHTVRNYFEYYAKKAKLEETYGYSSGTIARSLRRLTTHSLRHYAITNFSKRNNGNIVLTSRFARHHKVETTMTYVHTDKDELYQSVMLSQDNGILEKVRKMQQL